MQFSDNPTYKTKISHTVAILFIFITPTSSVTSWTGSNVSEIIHTLYSWDQPTSRLGILAVLLIDLNWGGVAFLHFSVFDVHNTISFFLSGFLPSFLLSYMYEVKENCDAQMSLCLVSQEFDVLTPLGPKSVFFLNCAVLGWDFIDIWYVCEEKS